MAFQVQARSDAWNKGEWAPAFTVDNPSGERLLPKFFRDVAATPEQLSTFDTESAARAVLLCLHLAMNSGDEFELRIVNTARTADPVRVDADVKATLPSR